jgi:7-carboxy-7-deazaguanine synthase
MHLAYINEVFASIQGEGPWIGQRQIFVRFQGCDIHCAYCDTPAALSLERDNAHLQCTAQVKPGLISEIEQVPNPVSGERLSGLCARLVIPGPSRPVLTLTGGEPLLQSVFLEQWLSRAREAYHIYLETSGIHDQAMRTIAHMIDVVSMDFKLPSATGIRPFWEEHKRFLNASRGKDLFVKAVVTRGTKREDVLTAARIIADFDASVPLILQPAGGAAAPPASLLVAFQDETLGIIQDVRVIPQAHKILNVP